MITVGVAIAVCVIAAVQSIRWRPRREHRPRAMMLALPAPAKPEPVWSRPVPMPDPRCDPPVIKHARHGRGTIEDGPEGSDCGCRTTSERFACAAAGCGFCRCER